MSRPVLIGAARPALTSLADLKRGAWYRVAERVERYGWLCWSWLLSDDEREMLEIERDEAGTVTTMHEHAADGGVFLLARRLYDAPRRRASMAFPGPVAGRERLADVLPGVDARGARTGLQAPEKPSFAQEAREWRKARELA